MMLPMLASPEMPVSRRVGSAAECAHKLGDPAGSATLRFQSQPTQPLDFFDVKVYTQVQTYMHKPSMHSFLP